jgi:hypothetical protein
MSALGADVMAVACIVGSAAVSGATTMALARGHHGADAVVACGAVAPMAATTPLVLSLDGGKATVVMTPRVRIRTGHGCAAIGVDVGRDVQMSIDEAMARSREARVRMEEARVRIEEAQRRMEEARVRGLTTNDEMRARIDKRIQERMKRLDKELAKLDAGTGR